MNPNRHPFLYACAMLCLTASAGWADINAFMDWPPGAGPAEIGKRIAENVMVRKFRYETQPEKASLGVIYPEVIAWYGALTVADLTKDADLTSGLVKKFELFLTAPGASRINRKAHVDYCVLGAVPLEIFARTRISAARMTAH